MARPPYGDCRPITAGISLASVSNPPVTHNARIGRCRVNRAKRCPARMRGRDNVATDQGPGGLEQESVAEAVVMGQGATDPVIELDERGIDLLKSWAHPCTEFRAAMQPDGSIVLHPMSAHDADLWRSGLVDEIIENFSRPERMIRLKADKL